jgi:hypothetical protein
MILWSLCISSVRSCSINIKPAILKGLVVSGHWEPAMAYQWILEVCREDARPLFLLHLAHGIWKLLQSDESTAEQLAPLLRESLGVALDQLLRTPVTSAAVQLAGDIISEMLTSDRLQACNRSLVWCDSAARQAEFFRALASPTQEIIIDIVAEKALSLEGIPRLTILRSLMAHIPVEKRGRFFEPFFLLSREFVSKEGRNGPNVGPRVPSIGAKFADVLAKSPVHSLADKQLTADDPELTAQAISEGPRHEATPANAGLGVNSQRAVILYVESKEKHEEVDEDRDALLDAINGVLYSMPTELLDRATEEFAGLCSPEIEQTLSELRRLRENRRSMANQGRAMPEPEVTASPEAVARSSESSDDMAIRQFYDMLNRDEFDDAVEMIWKEHFTPGLKELERLLEKCDERELDAICCRLSGVIRSMSLDQRHLIAALVAGRSTRAMFPFAVWSTISKEKLVQAIHQIQQPGTDPLTSVLCCLYFGQRDLSEIALERHLCILDKKDEAAAVYSMIPYLPRPIPGDLVEGLDDEDTVGEQITALTRILVSLARSVDAAALREIVESATRFHSEWWVVEALTMTLTRIDSVESIHALSGASKYIVNADLRCRLLTRVAVRAADLGHSQLALNLAQAIELLNSRWQALVELSRRFASAGDFPNAESAADSIAADGDRSHAFFEVAMELGAQGRREEALALIEERVTDHEWRQVAKQLMGGQQPKGIDRAISVIDRISSRRAKETLGESSLTICLESLSRQLSGSVDLSDIRIAASDSNPQAFADAHARLWGNDGTDSFTSALNREFRPQLLQIVGSLAPLIGSANEERAVRVVNAVRNVCGWWP